jgi:hypothetical protein
MNDSIFVCGQEKNFRVFLCCTINPSVHVNHNYPSVLFYMLLGKARKVCFPPQRIKSNGRSSSHKPYGHINQNQTMRLLCSVAAEKKPNQLPFGSSGPRPRERRADKDKRWG